MSKLVKDLVTKDLRGQLAGVSDALLVNVVGLDAIRTSKLRRELRSKNIHLEVVKNSLARRAAEGTPLAAAFEARRERWRSSGAPKTLSRWRRKSPGSPS